MEEQQKQKKNKKRIVANFELGKIIGTGTFATVRQAMHLPTKEKVSIKVLHKKLIVDARDQMNLSRQMRIIKQLRHPHIAQLFQIIESKHKIYLVMENAIGGQLYEAIVNSKKGHLQQSKANKYFQQLLCTIEYLHSLGITHRDIKPQNIMIDHCDSIKLIDFGLSNLYQKGENLATACGSPCYAAPEMLNQKSYDPCKADLWSCGIVLYTMLCGYLPFEHDSTSELCRLMIKGQYQEPTFLSLEAKDLLRKMLRADPRQRLNFSQIRRHPFCFHQSQPISKGIFPNQIIRLEPSIIMQMKDLGMQGFVKDIESNKTNQNTLTYYLLLSKYLKSKNISLAQYFQNILQVKPPFRSRSIVMHRYENLNPQKKMSEKTKKDMISLINLSNKQESEYFQRLKIQSLQKLRQNRSIRIKKII